MIEMFKVIGFLFLFFRFAYWIGLSLERIEVYSARVFLGQLVEGLLLFFFFHQFFGGRHIFPFSQNVVTQVFGFCLVVTGVFIAFLAKWQLKGEWVYASSYQKQKGEHLITKGIYRFVRHPIYAGILLSYIGAEVLVGSWLWISMLFFVIPFYIQAKKEERFLLYHFGQKYQTYMSQTKMFVPFIL